MPNLGPILRATSLAILHIALAPRGDRVNIVVCPYSDRRNRDIFWGAKIFQIVERPYCDRTEIVPSPCGARTMLPTMDLQVTMPTANRRNITPP